MRKVSEKPQVKKVCADVKTHPSRGGIYKGRHLDSKTRPVTRGLLPTPYTPHTFPPSHTHTGSARGAAARVASCHGVPDPENKRTHTAWGLGDGPRAEGQVYKGPVGPSAGPSCRTLHLRGGCLASQQSWLPRLLSQL